MMINLKKIEIPRQTQERAYVITFSKLSKVNLTK